MNQSQRTDVAKRMDFEICILYIRNIILYAWTRFCFSYHEYTPASSKLK